MELESDGGTNCNWCFWYYHQKIGAKTGRLGHKRTIGDYANDSIIEIGQNTEESPTDLRIFAATQTPERNHQPPLV